MAIKLNLNMNVQKKMNNKIYYKGEIKMKRKFLLCLIGVLVLTGCGKDTIAKKDFETGLNNFIKSEVNEDTYEAKLKDEKMIITYWDNDYT